MLNFLAHGLSHAGDGFWMDSAGLGALVTAFSGVPGARHDAIHGEKQ